MNKHGNNIGSDTNKFYSNNRNNKNSYDNSYGQNAYRQSSYGKNTYGKKSHGKKSHGRNNRIKGENTDKNTSNSKMQEGINEAEIISKPMDSIPDINIPVVSQVARIVVSIIGFWTSNFATLFLQGIVMIVMVIVFNLFGEWILSDVLFGVATPQEKMFVHRAYPFAKVIVSEGICAAVTLICYIYMTCLRNPLLKMKLEMDIRNCEKDEKKIDIFDRYERKTSYVLGLHMTYIIAIILFLGGASGKGISYSTASASGYDEDWYKMGEDYALYKRGEPTIEKGTFYVYDDPELGYKCDMQSRVQRDKRVEYLIYEGEGTTERVCLISDSKWYKSLDLSNAITYEITYLPYSKVVMDIKPVTAEAKEQEAARKCYGYDMLSEAQKKVFDIMYSEKMAEPYLTRDREEDTDRNIFEVYLEAPMDRDTFGEVANTYDSYYFGQPFKEYKYDQYGTRSTSMIITHRSLVYYNIDLDQIADEEERENYMPMISLDPKEYNPGYMADIDAIIADMPEFDTDIEKVRYLGQYIVDNTKPYDIEKVDSTDKMKKTILYHTGYGVIHEGCGDALGYAQALHELLRRCNIECIGIHPKNADYYWNMVKLDGKWYHVNLHGVDQYIRNDCMFFTDSQIPSIFGTSAKEEDLVYGYTDFPAPKSAKKPIACTMSFELNESEKPESIARYKKAISNEQYPGFISNILKDSDSSKYELEESSTKGIPMGADLEEGIRNWVEYTFTHVNTYDPEANELMEFEYGKTMNPVAEKLFEDLSYVCTKNITWNKNKTDSVYNKELKGFNKAVYGYPAIRSFAKVDHIKETYKILTGMEPKKLNMLYETQDKTRDYMYDKDWDIVVMTASKPFEDMSGNPYIHNISVNLYKFPMKACVEKIEKTSEGYEVVFYTRYSGYGEFYFNIDLKVNEDNSVIIQSIKERY